MFSANIGKADEAHLRQMELLEGFATRVRLDEEEYDTQQALKVFRQWGDSHTHHALRLAYPVYLPGVIDKLKDALDKDPLDEQGVERGLETLAYVVGPKRYRLFSGITAELRCRCE